MESVCQHPEFAAVLIARIFLGIIFFFQGYDAVFNIGIKSVIQTYKESFINKGIPRFLIASASFFACYSELVGGVFLIVGIFHYFALYILALNLLIAAIGFGLNTPMWDMRFVFPRLMLILLLLIVPQSWNVWSLDSLFFKF